HQIPRDRKKAPVKDIFRAPEGYELWEADYSQMELRFGVVYAPIEAIRRIYFEGGDVHHQTATLIGAYDLIEDPDRARQIGKKSKFLFWYEGGAEKFQWSVFKEEKIVLPLDFCVKFHKQFHNAYPELKQTSRKVEAAMAHNGFIKLWNGRKRRITKK